METMKLSMVFRGARGVAFAFLLAAPLAAGCADTGGEAPAGPEEEGVSASVDDGSEGEPVGEAAAAISQPDFEWLGLGYPCTLNGSACTRTGNDYFGLMNNFIDQYVVYGERSYGINLVWYTASNPGNVRFVPNAGASTTIKYDQPVALFVANPNSQKYIKYGERDYGINLVWSSTPVYQWRITGGVPGTNVDFSKPFGLKNTTPAVNTHVVYCEREYGINLRWNTDCAYR